MINMPIGKRRMPKAFLGFMAMVLALPVMITTPRPAPQAQAVIHPMLLESAAKTPDKMVNVIVQKSSNTDAPDKRVQALGGTVTQKLTIINAIVAELPAKSVSKLAAAGNIRAITPDAEVTDTATKGETVAVDKSAPEGTLVSAIRSQPVRLAFGTHLLTSRTGSNNRGRRQRHQRPPRRPQGRERPKQGHRQPGIQPVRRHQGRLRSRHTRRGHHRR